MVRFHVRCRKCETRRVLPFHPDQYNSHDKAPKCRCCAERDYRLDAWMMRRNVRAMTCVCAGYWFWHRRGSLYCWHRADGSTRTPGDPDFADRNLTDDEVAALIAA